MKNIKTIGIIGVVAMVGFSGLAIVNQMHSANQLSKFQLSKPALIESFADGGDPALIAEVKISAIQLIEARANLSNVDAQTAQRNDIIEAEDVRLRVQELVSRVWAKKKVSSSVGDILRGWDLAKEDPDYAPWMSSKYEVESWQGVHVSSDGNSAQVALTGRMAFTSPITKWGEFLGQDQVTLVKQDGEWRLSKAIKVKG